MEIFVLWRISMFGENCNFLGQCLPGMIRLIRLFGVYIQHSFCGNLELFL